MAANNVVRGTFAIILMQVISYLVMGLFYVFVTKTGALTETDLGMISVLTVLGLATVALTGLALPTALAKYVSESLKKNQNLQAAAIRKTVNISVLVTSILGLIVSILLSGPISFYFWKSEAFAPMIILMSCFAFFQSLMTLYNSSLQASFLFEKVAVVTFVWVVLSRFLGAFLAFLHLGVYGVMIGYVVGYGAAFAVSFLYGRGRISSPSGYTSIRPLLHFSAPLFLSSVILLALNWADIVVLASLTSNYASLGIYYLATQSVTFLSALYVPLAFTALPLLSAQHAVNDSKGVDNTLRIVSRYLNYLMLPCCIGLAVIAPTALRFFYGPQYVYGSVSFTILSLAQVMVAFYSVFIATLTATGKTRVILTINIVSVLAYIGLLLVLVPSFTGVGAASARFTMYAINLALTVYVLNKVLKIRVDKESMWKSTVASIAMVPVLVLTERIFPYFSMYLLVLDVMVGVGVYLLLLYLLKALNHEDFELLRRTFPSLRKSLGVLEKVTVRKG